MALKSLNEYLRPVPEVSCSSDGSLWSSYDEGEDVEDIHFYRSGPATDSELTDDDIFRRYNGDEVTGTKPKPRWELHFGAMAKAGQVQTSVRRLGPVTGFGSDVSLHRCGVLAGRRMRSSALGLGLLFPGIRWP